MLLMSGAIVLETKTLIAIEKKFNKSFRRQNEAISWKAEEKTKMRKIRSESLFGKANFQLIGVSKRENK